MVITAGEMRAIKGGKMDEVGVRLRGKDASKYCRSEPSRCGTPMGEVREGREEREYLTATNSMNFSGITREQRRRHVHGIPIREFSMQAPAQAVGNMHPFITTNVPYAMSFRMPMSRPSLNTAAFHCKTTTCR
jgi:hypothetical protein